ncbi:hypothetical protein FGB62_37g322 [Gracilaria domingensis]|nr:hypothetical protein FGB62_37g322 [Gracilaria domingensis]
MQASNPAPTSHVAQPAILNQEPDLGPAHSIPQAEIAELQGIVEQQRGSLANHQNRMRAMQGELDSLRALDVENIRTENTRLTAALTAATQESARLQEQLSYTKRELSSLRDRRKIEALAMSHDAGDTQQAASQVAGTQVPGTQAPATPGTQVKARVRRGVPLSARRPPLRESLRRPRPLDLKPKPSARNPRVEHETPSNDKGNEPPKTKRSMKRATSRRDCWQLQLNDSMNNTTKAALRQHLFSGAIGTSLWQMARVSGQEHLRDAMLAGLSNDDEWPTLLEPLTDVLDAGRGAALTSLNCTYGLLVYSDQCRRNIETLLAITGNLTDALNAAALRVDFEIADKCLQVLRVMFDAVVLHGSEEQVTQFRTQVFGNVVLNWTRRMRVFPKSIPPSQRKLSSKVRHSALSVLEVGVTVCLTSISSPCDEDLRVLEETLIAAGDVLRAERHPPQSALAILTSAACHAPSTVDGHGVAALSDAFVHAVQTLRVADTRAQVLQDRMTWEEDIATHLRERKKLAAFARGCLAALALIARTRKLMLRKSERNVILGVLSVLAWPTQRKDGFHPPKELYGDAFVAECRTVWMAFRRHPGT